MAAFQRMVLETTAIAAKDTSYKLPVLLLRGVVRE